MLQAGDGDAFTFSITADMRNYAGPGTYDTAQYVFMIHVDGDAITFATYRDDDAGGPYTLTSQGVLAGKEVWLPLVVRE